MPKPTSPKLPSLVVVGESPVPPSVAAQLHACWKNSVEESGEKNHCELIKPSSAAPGALAVQGKQINQPMVKNSLFDYCPQSSSKDSITT